MSSHFEALAGHMHAAVTTYGHDRLELEWRLGHRQGSFRPGVGADAWRRLQAALDASPAFQRTHKHTVEQLGDSTGVKCVTERDPAGKPVGKPTWMHKKRLADVDTEPTDPRPWSVRASVSLEEEEGVAPGSVKLKYERSKQRWSYRHRCWSIDLTQVRSNLPTHLDDDQDCFEVEIELVDQGMLFERPLRNLVEWGWKLADEVCGLMSESKSAGAAGAAAGAARAVSWCDLQ